MNTKQKEISTHCWAMVIGSGHNSTKNLNAQGKTGAMIETRRKKQDEWKNIKGLNGNSKKMAESEWDNRLKSRSDGKE